MTTETSKLDNKDSYKYRYQSYSGPGLNPGLAIEYKADEVLSIDGGDNDWSVETKASNYIEPLTGPAHTPYTNGAVGVNQVIYIGNFGTMMFRKSNFNYETMRYITLNHADLGAVNYMKSQQMKYNMQVLLSGISNLIIECEVSGFFPYPDDLLSFVNPPRGFEYAGNEYHFEILSLEADYSKGTTKFQLRKKQKLPTIYP